MLLSDRLAERIQEEGKVSKEIRKEFFGGKGFGYIRDWLEKHNLDRHMPLELDSTEVALVTPKGILMQIRQADDGKLGFFGGCMNDGETPKEGAIREIMEETGLSLKEEDLELSEDIASPHEYPNGDKVLFRTYRYIAHFDEVPKIKLDEESLGSKLVTEVIDLKAFLDEDTIRWAKEILSKQ